MEIEKKTTVFEFFKAASSSTVWVYFVRAFEKRKQNCGDILFSYLALTSAVIDNGCQNEI